MSDSILIAESYIPLGYFTPSFPSLHFPINSDAFQTAYLYYIRDIWRFTLYWTIIFFASFHACAGIWAAAMHRKLIGGLWIVFTYLLVAVIQAVISGSLVGLMLGAIYRAGLFGMTTWVPFVWGGVQILFMVVRSYSMMSTFL